MINIDDFSLDTMKELNLTTDRRTETSPINGKLGGRKHIPVYQWAVDFLKSNFTLQVDEKTFYSLRFHAGEWYDYRGDYWHTLHKKDLEAQLVGYLQKNGYAENERISETVIRDVITNLNSSELCNLYSEKYKIPCFIPSGESAVVWMPTQNCVLDIEQAAQALANGDAVPDDAIREHSPELFATFGLPYPFDETANCPRWKKYLEEVQPEEGNRLCLQMLAGLSLVPDCRYNVAFFLFGEAGTGKSVFLNVLSALVGRDNICNVPLAKLADRFGLAPLTEKLLNVVGEMPTMPESGRIADIEGVFKDITSGGVIPVERKGIDAWNARAIARMLFATNTLPSFTDRSSGVWDRLRIIPFNQRIRGTDRQNPNLTNELLEELSGILNWALLGLAELRKRKTFPECPEGEKLKDQLRQDCDHERTFLLENVEPSTGSWCSSDSLFRAYREWTTNNGYRSVGAANFKRAVKRLYPAARDGENHSEAGRQRVFFNIRVKTEF